MSKKKEQKKEETPIEVKEEPKTENSIKQPDNDFRVEQFKKFYELLMKNAPAGYKPWLFPCNKNGKDPCAEAIKKLDKSNIKASWKHDSARLDYEEVIEHIKQGYNIGISARANDCLIIGDIDNPQFLNQIPNETLTTTSRKRIGGHFFGLNKDNSAKINLPTDNGEIRSYDQYVLCVGSYVPFDLESRKDKKAFEELSEEAKNDKYLGYYTIRTELPLRELGFGDLPEFFREYHKKESEEQNILIQNENKKEYKEFVGEGKYSELLSLKMSDIIGKLPEERRVGHPLHDSDTDANFSLSSDGNVCHCWRHLVSLNAVQFLCVKAGYKGCRDAGTPHKIKDANGKKISQGVSKLKGDKQALEIAYQEALKMGLVKEWKPKTKPQPISNEVLSGRFVFDSSKIVKPAIFSCHKIGDAFGYGFLLPKEVPIFEGKGEERRQIGKRQIRAPVVITSDKQMIEPNPDTETKFKIKYTAIPTELDLRIETEVLESYLKGEINSIDGKELFEEMKKEGYEKFLYFQNSIWYDIHTIWDMNTYFFELYNAFPIMELRGLSGSAKSKVMKVSKMFTLNPTEIMVNPSEATLFRTTHSKRPTKYIDEAEKLFLFVGGQWQSSPVVELINGSYTKGSSVPRLEKEGNSFKLVSYQCYSPTMVGSIAGLRDATETRAITHIMTKSPDNDKRGELEVDDFSGEEVYQKIRNKLYLFAFENWDKVEKAYKQIEITTLKKRDLQLWRPILALAKTLNEELFNNILKFAEKVSEQRKDDFIPEGSMDYRLLSIIKDLLDCGNDKIYIKDIAEEINRNVEKKTSNKTISTHLDKLGFKEFRTRDNQASCLEINKSVFEVIVNPICPTLSTYSTYSTLNRGKEEKSSVEEVVNSGECKESGKNVIQEEVVNMVNRGEYGEYIEQGGDSEINFEESDI